MRFPGLSALFGAPKPAPVAPLPPIPEPAVMPDPDDKGVKMAQRRKSAKRRQRSGRLSTMNIDGYDTLGAGGSTTTGASGGGASPSMSPWSFV